MLSGRTILDDRREPVELQRRPPFVKPWRLRMLLGMPSVRTLLKSLAWSVLLIACGFVALLPMSTEDDFPGWHFLGVPSAVLLIANAIVYFIVQRRDVPYRARQNARRRACPACAYDLRDTKLDGQGMARCPECGGVWHLETTPATRAAIKLAPVLDDRAEMRPVIRQPPPAAPQPWSWRDFDAMPGSYRGTVLVFTAGWVLVMWLYGMHRFGQDAPIIGVIAEVGIWFCVYGILTDVLGPVFNAPRFAPGCCRCCGTPIRGLEPEMDGLVACPTCSAAWKL